MKTVVILPDGTKLTSGSLGGFAVEAVTLTQNINEEYCLTPGTVAAETLEMTVLTGGQTLPVEAGDLLTVYTETETGSQYFLGFFRAEKPVQQSANRMKLTACDAVSLLDKDLTAWLAELTGWPYSLGVFAELVCEACGVQLTLQHCLNQSFAVEKFTAGDVTGRQLMRWICQAAGAFCQADNTGGVRLGWYVSHGMALTPGGDSFYYQGSFSRGDYTVQPVTRVCLRQSGEDVGISYPESAEVDNPWVITGNPLLATDDTGALLQVAKNLYGQMCRAFYTPCKVTVPATLGMTAGDVFTVTDQNGVTVTGIVMSRTRKGSRDTIQCTGSLLRTDSAAKNSLTRHALSGKVMNLTATVDGLRTENKDSAGKIAAMELTVSGISAEVSRQSQRTDTLEQDVAALGENAGVAREQVARLGIRADSISAEVSRQDMSLQEISRSLTLLEQTAQKVEISVQTIAENGVSQVQTETGYTFGADGLRIQKSGQEMENVLDETGMTVSRGDTVMLRANSTGVLATDVTVRNYLIVGSHARFEDHDGGRTACFYI